MLNLNLTTDKISLITGSAADVDVHAAWVEHPNPFTTSSSATPGTQNTAITTATTTDIVSVPSGGSITKNVKKINIRNKDSADSTQVTVQFNANGTLYQLHSVLLLAGEELTMNDQGVWFHYDSNGGVYGQALPVASDTVVGGIEIASQAEMEAGTDTTRAVTPGRQHYHPSAIKFWVQTTGGATQVEGQKYNVTSIADTAVGRMTVTIANDFSSANWVCIATTVTSTTTGDEGICNINSKAAGTVEVGNRIVTPAFADMNVGYDVAGLGDQ